MGGGLKCCNRVDGRAKTGKPRQINSLLCTSTTNDRRVHGRWGLPTECTLAHQNSTMPACKHHASASARQHSWQGARNMPSMVVKGSQGFIGLFSSNQVTQMSAPCMVNGAAVRSSAAFNSSHPISCLLRMLWR